MAKKQPDPEQADLPKECEAATATPKLTEETQPGEVVKFILRKCLATLNEDIDNLSAKDRIMLWKEYGDYFATDDKLSDIPGMNTRNVNLNIRKNESEN
jgi:hypothetical protein